MDCGVGSLYTPESEAPMWLLLFMRATAVLELFLLVLSLFVSSYLASMVFKIPVFHRNLTILCGFLFLAMLCAFVPEMAVVCYSFKDYRIMAFNRMILDCGPLRCVEWIRMASFGFAMTNVGLVVGERFLATARLKSYEKHFHNKLMICCFLYNLGAGVGLGYLVMNGMVKIYVMGIFGVFYTAFLVTSFTLIFRYNKKRYFYSHRYEASGYTLSERYQLFENIRSMTMMRKSVLLTSAGNVLIMLVVVLSVVVSLDTDFYVRKCVGCLLPLYIITFAVVIINDTPLFRKEHLRLTMKLTSKLRQRQAKIRSAAIGGSRVPHLTTLNGRIMAFKAEDEAQLYFEQLKNSWQ